VSGSAEQADKRIFPRIEIRCPALYRVEGAARQLIALAVDFSATGVKMLCKDALPVNTRIHVELKPGSDRTIPAVCAEGHVVRCEPYERGGFWVSCRFDKIRPPGK